MNSLLILLAIVVIGFFLLKYTDLKHRFRFFMVIFVIVFFLLSFAYVFFTNDLDLTSFSGLLHAVKLYFAWFGTFTGNIIKISGFAVKQDWSANLSNFTAG
jgi:hypothetical protein